MSYFQPIAIVVPHHNLVESTRQNFIQTIAKKRLTTRHIILISPDHFSTNQNLITTSTRTWNLSTGKAIYNNTLKLDYQNNDIVLQNDHGIYNPLTDLLANFKDADFQPILIGQKVTSRELEPLIKNLKKYCGFDCLLVSSVDFSHYLPATLAEVHDAFTINNLQNLNTSNILKSEVDSPQSLYVLASFSQSNNANKWTMYAHTNSGYISNNPDVETTTHVFGSYQRGLFRPSTTITNIYTPYALIRSQNQITLGDRFFYGVNNFVTVPNQDNFVISEIITPTITTKSYLPVSKNNFLKGSAKQLIIKKYFDTIPSETNLTKDYYWGKLIYDQASNTH